MNVRALFGLSAAMGVTIAALIAWLYVWPRLRTWPRQEALALLAVPHAFRFVGLSFLVSGVVSPALPRAFAVPAAYGDLMTALLAIGAIVALSKRWWWGIPLVGIMNVVGAADLAYATYQGNAVDLDAGALGAAFFIPTALVPVLLLAHVLSFRLLLARRAARQPRSTRFDAVAP